MSDRAEIRYMSEQDYLQAEEKSTVKHEYVDGYVFAMAGATQAHSIIGTNLVSAIRSHLRGTGCRVFANDMQVHIESTKTYYYPDVIVTCEPFDAKSVFISNPTLIIEILSHSTAAIDRREKLIAYRKIEHLKEYVIIYQDRKRVELYRKTDSHEWESLIIAGHDDLLLESLPSGDLRISLKTIYEDYDPPGRVKEEEGAYYLKY